MHKKLQSSVISVLQYLLCLGLLLGAGSLLAQTVQTVPVNIFGDADPENGIEDDREQLMGGRHAGSGLLDQRLNSGTIKCDGKIRGTAMVADTRDINGNLKGVVLVSAAHVVYDLDNQRLFKRCEFHFLGLGELYRYRAKIDLTSKRLGGFDPTSETADSAFGEGDWAFLYVPKPWKNFNADESLKLRDFAGIQLEAFQQSGGEFRLIAFDSSTGVMSVSRNCSVFESGSNDIGGGSWRGQLLDDCDSTGGASGGGIVAVEGRRQFLVGIRSGSHWSDEMFPASDYPAGPPDGSAWDRKFNTNFGRAIDAQLLAELNEFVRELVLMENDI